MVANPFSTELAARMYAAGRPDYSPTAGPILRRLVGLDAPVPLALDVACGTGISTKMLTDLARRVIGVDQSPAMLDHAPRRSGITYMLGNAEDLPIGDETCDLISVGSALHWFDFERFLNEVDRVAMPGAMLAVHNHWFAAEMEGVPEFSPWSRGAYVEQFPTPPRDRTWLPPENLGPWRHVAWERYDHQVEMSPDRLTAYLMTQSNVQAVLARGAVTPPEVASLLEDQLTPFFAGADTARFTFGGYVACHRR